MLMLGMITLLVLSVRWQLEASAALRLRPVSVCITECMPLNLQLNIIIDATLLFLARKLPVVWVWVVLIVGCLTT